MPTTKSAKKRLRQSQEKREQNRSVKSVLRTTIRKVREAVAEGNFEEAESQFRLLCKRLDRAGSRNVIHPNKAARTKSRISASIKAAKSGA